MDHLDHEDIPAVISTPFYMNRVAGQAAAAEDAPVREKIGGPDSADKRRRHPNRRGGRPGEPRQQADASPNRGGQRPKRQEDGRLDQRPKQSAAPAQQSEGNPAKRRRPHHRGGRRRRDTD